MDKRSIQLTLEEAKKLYKEGDSNMKSLILTSFTEDELNDTQFKNIKTFRDAIAALGLCETEIEHILTHLEFNSIATAAMFKLNIIKRALNLGKSMPFTKGPIWYPYTPCVTINSIYYNDEIKKGTMKKVSMLQIEGEGYHLLGGHTHCGTYIGLGDFDSSCGVAFSFAPVGFLGCACKEIAKHMSEYFAKEIFEAKYGDTINYKWV